MITINGSDIILKYKNLTPIEGIIMKSSNNLYFFFCKTNTNRILFDLADVDPSSLSQFLLGYAKSIKYYEFPWCITKDDVMKILVRIDLIAQSEFYYPNIIKNIRGNNI